eukprot:scaffold322263_cov33-Tisochrysis_lutea.AAC.1
MVERASNFHRGWRKGTIESMKLSHIPQGNRHQRSRFPMKQRRSAHSFRPCQQQKAGHPSRLGTSPCRLCL